jgi:hypothetical protein
MKNEETTHAPAPWAFSKGSSPHNQGQVYDEDNGKTLAVTYNDEDGANARLIAAAPDMLAALRAIAARVAEDRATVGSLGYCYTDSAEEDCADIAREAIARATAQP